MKVSEYCADKLFYIRELQYCRKTDIFDVNYYVFEKEDDAADFMMIAKSQNEDNIYTWVDKDEEVLEFVNLKDKEIQVFS